MKSRKEREARDIAGGIADTGETDVDPDDLDKWQSYDVYEWLEAWGWSWDDTGGWIPPTDDE